MNGNNGFVGGLSTAMSVKDVLTTIGEEKVVAVALSGSAASWAVWHAWFKSAGVFAGELMPIAALAVLILTGYVRWAGRPKPEAPAPLARTSAKAGAAPVEKTNWWKKAVIAAAVTVGLFGVLAFLFKSNAHASPALVQQPVTSARQLRGKSDDDAGGDDVEPVDVPLPGGWPLYFAATAADIGLREKLPNGKPNPDVSKMFECVGMSAKTNCITTPWCAAYVNWRLSVANVPGTGSPMARSFIQRPKSFELVCGRNPSVAERAKVKSGNIATIWRGRSDDGETGHVTFFVRDRGDGYFIGRGGNQSDMVCEQAFPWSKVLGVVRPRSLAKSKNVQAAIGQGVAGAAGGGAAGYAGYEALKPGENVAGSNVETTLQNAQGVGEAIKGPLEMVGTPTTVKIAIVISLACAAITIGLALYAWHRQRKEHRGEV